MERNPPLTTTQLRQPGTLIRRKQTKMTVCELYAGIAIMSRFMMEAGWTVTCACECAEHLYDFIQKKMPNADTQRDCDDKPWLEWAQKGITAMVIVAGIACQPFSGRGLLKRQHDARAFQFQMVLEAAVTLGAMYVLLENIPRYVDDDHIHGVFSQARKEFSQAGYELYHVFRPKHNETAVLRSSRERCLMLFKRTDVRATYSMDVNFKMHNIVRKPRVGDRTRNWRLYGEFTPYDGDKLEVAGYLQLGSKSITNGSIIKRKGDRQLWRVDSINGRILRCCSVDHTSNKRLKIAVENTIQVTCRYGRYEVLKHDAIIAALLSWGEYPGQGGPLILLMDGWICGLAEEDRAEETEVTTEDIALLKALGATAAEIRAALGNSIPRSILIDVLLELDKECRSILGDYEISSEIDDGPECELEPERSGERQMRVQSEYESLQPESTVEQERSTEIAKGEPPESQIKEPRSEPERERPAETTREKLPESIYLTLSTGRRT